MGTFVQSLKPAEFERLTRLYEALCRFTWPAPPESATVPLDNEGMAALIVRPPMTPAGVAHVITAVTETEGVRYRLLHAYESDLWHLVRSQGTGK